MKTYTFETYAGVWLRDGALFLCKNGIDTLFGEGADLRKFKMTEKNPKKKGWIKIAKVERYSRDQIIFIKNRHYRVLSDVYAVLPDVCWVKEEV